MKFVDSHKTCLLEIKLPKEITKSPAAMEIFFANLSKGGSDNFGEAFLDGKTRPWFSCELVSTGGQVRFFVYCSQIRHRNLVENQLYGQFPNIEIIEVDDYTKDFYFNLDKYFITGFQYTLGKPDPYPIKTYVDYGLGLGEDQKEEYKIDPLTSVIEYLGSLKKGENAWIQILFQKHEKEGVLHNRPGKGRELKKEVEKEIEKIRKEAIPKSAEGYDDIYKFPNPTKGQTEIITALERNAAKSPFDCMIRSVYIAEEKSVNRSNVSGLSGAWKHFRALNMNGFRTIYPSVEDWQKDVARVFPFLQKGLVRKETRIKKDIFYAYKLRSFFQWPYKNFGKTVPVLQFWDTEGIEKSMKPFILSTEELATIFHFPSGMVSQTPTLERVPSKKSEAPANLPI